MHGLLWIAVISFKIKLPQIDMVPCAIEFMKYAFCFVLFCYNFIDQLRICYFK